MACSKANVPEYLHSDDKQILNEDDFLDDELIYRLAKKGNPIEFPSTLTSYSCRWSKILQIQDIYNGDHPDYYDDYKFNCVLKIKALDLIKLKNDGNYLGWHRLNCRLEHKPTPCDYSHVEINIQHRIYDDNQFDVTEPYYNMIYKYDMWQNGLVILSGDQSFFKKFRKEYRNEMVKIFCFPN